MPWFFVLKKYFVKRKEIIKNELSDEEYKELSINQDIYLNYVISEMDKNLNFKFNLKYKIAYSLAKLQYWASK